MRVREEKVKTTPLRFIYLWFLENNDHIPTKHSGTKIRSIKQANKVLRKNLEVILFMKRLIYNT